VAVANHPGETEYNPLVVYGDVGLGKTHLAQAIANHSLASKTAERACYVSSERFTSEFVTAIRNDEFSTFSSFYRGLDLLVVDDIQFIGGKEKTQEEFFHLFNDLHQNGKQIVLCADRPPNQIDGLETRLLSRFQWGLTADIQRPGLEMRVAILQLKAEKYGLPLSQEVFELVAQNITENIRQLEGALKQLAAHSQLTDGSLTAEDASSILGESVSPEKKPRQPSVEDIIHVVSENQSVDPESLIERGRRQDISLARQVAMYFSRKMTDLSYASIGQRFGGRDHSTVIHACRKVEDLIDVEPGFEDDLVSLRSEIRQAAR
jgi:chromosomal replication initiator protein